VEIPGFKYNKLRDLARFMERMSGIPMQQHEPIIGANVFAHESGIHTHAMLIDHRMYEAVPAALVGGETKWVFGKHSGVALVEQTLRKHSEELAQHGIDVTPELAQRVTDEIKRLREERAASSKGEEAIDAYEAAMRQLSMSESDVADIAVAIAKPQAAA
jgi:isopropylmalate/homocitrate/citramalate synthase